MRLSEAIPVFSQWRSFRVKPSTVRGYDQDLRMFCLFLRDPHVEQVTLSNVLEYLGGLRQLGWNENTLIPKCSALRKFFRFMRLRGYKALEADLIPLPRAQYGIPRVATEEDYRKLLAVIPSNNDPRHPRNLAILNLLWDTGARNGEVVALNVEALDTARMRSVIKTEKSRGRRPIREIFWTHETNENIGRWIETRKRVVYGDQHALFVCATGSKVGQRFTIKGVGEMLRRYSERAKLPVINAHSFRHRIGHEVIRRGGSASDVMNILGHASLASSTVYTMMMDYELEGRYRKLIGA
jgi:site-specific recombinase XerD